MGENDKQGGAGPVPWPLILQFVGAAAGFVAFFTLIGGWLLWLRFDELGLPAERSVAALPQSMLTSVGFQSLVGPAIAGLVAVIVLLAVRPETWPRWVRRTLLGLLMGAVLAAVLAVIGSPIAVVIALPLALAVVVGWPVYNLIVRYDEKGYVAARAPAIALLAAGLLAVVIASTSLTVVPHLLILGGITLLAILLVESVARRGGGRGALAVTVFAAFVFVGAAIAVLRTSNAPTMEPVAVQLKEPDEVLAGFFVGESGDRIYVAELPDANAFAASDRVDTVVAVDRERVVRTLLRKPASLRTDEDGRAHVQALAAAVKGRLDPDPPTVAAPTAADRARIFGPLLHLNVKEPVSPTSADYFLDNGTLQWKHRENCREPGVKPDAERMGSGGYSHRLRCDHSGPAFNSEELTRPFDGNRPAGLEGAEGFYVDLDDRRRRPPLRYKGDGGQRILRNEGVTAYWEEHDAGNGWRRITYWFFYPLSIPPGTEKVGDRFAHEGDWESMSVLLMPDPKKKGNWSPRSVRYSAHQRQIDLPWRRVLKATDGRGRQTHPVGFVAKGSHATYPSPGRYKEVLVAADRRIVEVDDVAFSCPDCPVWLTWVGAKNAKAEPWYGFGGAWGQVSRRADGSGILGPSRYRAGPANPDPEESLGATAP